MQFKHFFSILILLTVGSIALAATDTPTCEQAQAWIKTQKLLPQDFNGISQIPTGYRSAVFFRLSPQAKSSITQASILSFVGNGINSGAVVLNEKQQNLVRVLAKKFTPAVYADRAIRKANVPTEQALDQAFGHENAVKIFTTIGRYDEAEAMLKVSLGGAPAGKKAPGPGPGPCSCSSGWSCGIFSGSCLTGGCSGGSTCGIGGTDPCVGRCYTAPEE